jgi:DNA polymerase-3 subunit alpha
MFLIFDTETTGLPRDYNAPVTDTDNWPRVVQLAWQLHDDEGKLVEVKNYIVRPDGFTIPFNAEKIHGISTARALKTGWPLQDVLAEFEKAVAQASFAVGHNIEFDIQVLRCEQHRLQTQSRLAELAVADSKTDKTAEFVAIPGGKGGKFKWPTLTELYQKLFNEGFSEAHNASADVEATARVFLELLRTGIYTEDDLKREKGFLDPLRSANPEPFRLIGLNVKPYLPDGVEFDTEESDAGLSRGELKKNLEALEEVPFAHLHNHSQFSVLQATSDIADLVKAAARHNMPAVGITDLGNMMGVFQFVKTVQDHNKAVEARKKDAEEKGEPFQETTIKPVVGAELYVCRNRLDKSNKDDGFRIPLFAKNKNGYHNLARLSSTGFIEGYYYVPRIDKEVLLAYKSDLIVSTGGLEGEVPWTILNVGEEQGEKALIWWKEHFGDDLYIELNRHGLEEEDRLNKVLLHLAAKHNIKVFASNNTYYINKEDAPAHDILLCVKEGEKRSTPIGRGRGFRYGFPNDSFWFKGQKEMKELFADVPEAIHNVAEIIDKVEPFNLTRDVLLPKFDIPAEFVDPEDENDGGKRGENAYLRHLTFQGAERRYGEVTPEITERLDFELKTIANTGYPGYFLIVQDFCAEARRMGVSVGPGRGSAAGSAVAYCIGITNVDPIKYDLLFERFLNPERVSLPDIDIDFDDEGRGKVIEYVINKYGGSQVAQIITYGTMAAKSSIRDTGRVLDLPLPDTDRIAKMLPDLSLAKLLSIDEKELREKLRPEQVEPALELRKLSGAGNLEGETVRQARVLEGSMRNTGIHACGVIITPSDIRDHIPVAVAKDNDMWCTQFDNAVVESAGLLKMDFLGLKTLTLIKDAIAIVKERTGTEIDPDAIPIDDVKTYELFQRGETVGVFQYESPGMQKYLKELKPTVFADLIAMNALYRPGPLEYIPNFIARKHGREPITYDLPDMEEYLKETYGITVYQEQVMLLSQKLAGFTKGMADKLRKGMGKKDKKVIDEMYPKFLEGGTANGHPKDILDKIWKDWEAFASYAFNKSHSTCYAWVAFQTGYLKANYPAAYMASVLSNNMSDIKQVTFFMEECRRMNLVVLGPDVNESNLKFAVNDKGEIRFGLGAVKGVGESAVESILRERNENGPFQSLFDLTRRIDLRACNKKTLEGLALAGALDRFTGANRAVFFADDNGSTLLEKAVRYGQAFQSGQSSAQVSMFDVSDEVDMPEPSIPTIEDWPTLERLSREKDVIGLYLSGHPLDDFRLEIRQFINLQVAELNDLDRLENREFHIACVVVRAEERMTRNGQPFGTLEVEDYYGSTRLMLFGDSYLKNRHFMVPGLLLSVEGKVARRKFKYGESDRLDIEYQQIRMLQEIRGAKTKGINLALQLTSVNQELIQDITGILQANKGDLRVNFKISDKDERLQVNMPMRGGGVALTDDLLAQLRVLEQRGLEMELLT